MFEVQFGRKNSKIKNIQSSKGSKFGKFVFDQTLCISYLGPKVKSFEKLLNFKKQMVFVQGEKKNERFPTVQINLESFF